MVMNINDLKCPCCYKKVKKLLCKFPQVRNQVFDEKQNTVSITVVCCSPEEIRHKLAKGGGKSVKSVVIKEPPKPKPEPAKPKETEKPKSDPKPDHKPKETEKPKSDPKPKETEKPEKPKVVEKEKEKEKPKEGPPGGAMMMTPQVPMGYPYSMGPVPADYYHPGEASGYGGGYVRAVPGYDNYGYGPYGGEYYGNNINRGNAYYSSEENPIGCTIM